MLIYSEQMVYKCDNSKASLTESYNLKASFSGRPLIIMNTYAAAAALRCSGCKLIMILEVWDQVRVSRLSDKIVMHLYTIF